MDRSAMLEEVWRHDFPLYTKRLRELIGTVYKARGDGRGWNFETDQHMVEAIWAEFASEFADTNREASSIRPDEAEAAERGELTASGRAAIIGYIDRAQAWKELADSDRAAFYKQFDELSKPWEAIREGKRRTAGEKRDRTAPFSRRKAQADFDFWAGKKSWSIEEAVALSFDKDPREVNQGTLARYKAVTGSPFRDAFTERLDNVQRAVAAKELKDPDKPAEFNVWFCKENVKLESGFKSVFAARQSATQSVASATTNLLHTSYQVLLGILIEKYGLDPKDNHVKMEFKSNLLHADLLKARIKIDKKTLDRTIGRALMYASAKSLPLRNATVKPVVGTCEVPPS